jgi:hypothetical protein
MSMSWLFRPLQVVAVICTTTHAAAQSLTLPEPELWGALRPYLDTDQTVATAKKTLNLLSDATLTVTPFELSVPRNEKAKSECHDDEEVTRIRRGHFWLASGYLLFTSLQEGRTEHLYLTNIRNFGRTALLKHLDMAKLAMTISTVLDANKLPPESRRDIVAYVSWLLEFRRAYERVVASKNLDWQLLDFGSMVASKLGLSGKVEDQFLVQVLVDKIDATRPFGEKTFSRCFIVMFEPQLQLMSGQKFHLDGYTGGGLATYSYGFWWRREREGTSGIAEAALRFAVARLAN